ncbi:hypothetical protein D3C81_1565860 [compost metagenome]
MAVAAPVRLTAVSLSMYREPKPAIRTSTVSISPVSLFVTVNGRHRAGMLNIALLRGDALGCMGLADSKRMGRRMLKVSLSRHSLG